MIFPIENFPVNWVDGMKISKDHFIDSDKHLHDLVRDSASVGINSYNFGLLPTPSHAKNVFDLAVAESINNTLEVKLKYCNAITLGGLRIGIEAQHLENSQLTAIIKGNAEQANHSKEVSWLDIVLVADPYHRVPVGKPSLEENPPRHPYSDIRYALQIIESEKISVGELGAYYLVLGKIKNSGGHFSILADYIPPCTSLLSHPELIKHYEAFSLSLQNIQGHSIKIVRKIHDKNRPSHLAKNFMQLCTQMLNYIANIYFKFRNELPQQSPIHLVECFSAMGNITHTTLQCMVTDEKEELLKYIYEWCDITPNDFEQVLLNIVEIKYNHYQIHEALLAVKSYLETMETIWGKMNTLEFIGQGKENIVVTKQTVQQTVEPAKKRWSILD